MKKRLLAVLMCFCIAFSMIPGMAFASERVYVALGDSITTGYGLSNVGTESFPALVAEENTLALTNLAKDGATSAGLLEVVQDTNNAAILSSADVITITIGGNDLMDALYGYIADEYNDKNNPDPPITASDVKDNILQYFEFAETVLPNFVGSATAKTAMQTLGSNLATAIKTIKDNNPDVQIIVATQYNPYKQAASTANQMIADQAKLINDVFNAGVAAMNSMVIQNVCTAVQCTVADVYAKFNGVSENPCNASFDNIFSINLDFHPNASGHRLIAEVINGVIELPAATEYSVTVDNDGNGTATATPTSAAEGTEITLTATPSEGYHFKEWQVISGSVTIENNKFTMPAGNVTVKAVFEKDAATEYTVTVENDGNGTATASPTSAAEGTEVTLTATPNEGYHFKEWQVVSGSVTIENNKFTMPAEAVTVKAVFEKDAATEYTVTVENDGNGTATASVTSAAKGTEVTLTATPNEGYHFKEWKVVSGSVTIENNKFTMPAGNVTVKAIFEKDAATEYTVTVENDGNGTATASPTSAAEGTEVTLIATPNEGYHFKEWKVVSGSVTIENNKFTMPAGDVKVKAVFEKDTPAVTEYTITFNGNGGYVSYTSATTSGGKLSVLPSAYRYGYTFTGWYTASGAQVSTDVIYTADITLYAGWRYIPVYIPEEPEYTRPVKPAEPDEPVAEWVEKNGGTCLYIDGKMVTGWYQDEETGKWYLFDQNTGVMAENKWSKVDGVWYLFDDNGEMLTGWQKVDGKWYYLKPWGGMANGWQYIDSVWYYLRADGSMVANGWVKTGGYWYYLTGSGSMATARWVEWKGDWYYIYSSGIMATNVTIDGYYINSAGVWVQ